MSVVQKEANRIERFLKLRRAVKGVYSGRLDLTGGVFGMLTVYGCEGVVTNTSGKKTQTWRCVCTCGGSTVLQTSDLTSGNSKSCGCGYNAGCRSPFWKGGRVRYRGYISVRARNHPSARKNGYVFEHRLVMEKKLGRYLLPEESVHHKNGVRDDNREENLELWSTYHPTGQRVEDQLEWARYILAMYGDCYGR